jgi:hypothetical protein
MWIFKKQKPKTSEEETNDHNERQEKYDRILKEEEQKTRFRNRLNILRFPTYTKNLVAVIVFVCLFDLQLSYILAFLGKETCIDLNIKLCETILAVACAYIFRAYFDNRAERAARGEVVPPSMVENILNSAKDKINNLTGSKSEPMMNGNEEFFNEFNEQEEETTDDT